MSPKHERLAAIRDRFLDLADGLTPDPAAEAAAIRGELQDMRLTPEVLSTPELSAAFVTAILDSPPASSRVTQPACPDSWIMRFIASSGVRTLER